LIYTLTLNPAIDREYRVPAIGFGEVLRADGARVGLGGKGFNVSRALRALGEPSVALGFVGGQAGRTIAAGMAGLGIATDLVEIAGGETRTNVTVVAPDRHMKVNEPGPAVTRGEEERLLARVRALARAGDLWVLSGSLPPGGSSGLYAEVIRVAQAAGARALLDTSGPALREGCEAGPFLAKPNAAEAAELTGLPAGTEEEVLAAAAAIHALGVTTVLVSLRPPSRSGTRSAPATPCWPAWRGAWPVGWRSRRRSAWRWPPGRRRRACRGRRWATGRWWSGWRSGCGSGRRSPAGASSPEQLERVHPVVPEEPGDAPEHAQRLDGAGRLDPPRAHQGGASRIPRAVTSATAAASPNRRRYRRTGNSTMVAVPFSSASRVAAMVALSTRARASSSVAKPRWARNATSRARG
jgi:1-phosphofructokinase family hexose kinase